MRQASALLEPVVDVRDVLESYLHDRVLVKDWRSILGRASKRFTELGQLWSDSEVQQLGRSLETLANTGPAADLASTRAVAADVGRLLDGSRVTGIPRPEDDDWSF